METPARPIPSFARRPNELSNASAKIGRLPPDPRTDRASVVALLQDFLLNTVAQNDDVSRGLVCVFAEQIVDNAIVFAKKQHDYGPGNIASFGEFGVLVRTSDKIARLTNLQGRPAVNESVGDSWLDVANYGVIAQMVRARLWPGCQEKHMLAPSTPPSDFIGDGTQPPRGTDFLD